jgi:HK97 family phage prohead protease
MYGGPAMGGWIEHVDPHAFDKTLRERPDLMLLINHEGMPLARTKSGTLKLSVDSHGLKVSAKLDRRDPDVQRLEAKMRRGDIDEMSFAFRVKAQTWSTTSEFPDDNQALRTILEVSLHKGDVSVVNYGANDTTHAEVKSKNGRKDNTMGRSLREVELQLRGEPVVNDAVMQRAQRLLDANGGTPLRASRRAAATSPVVVNDAIMKRAQRLLASYRPSPPGPVPSVAPSLRSAHNRTIAMALPPIGVAVQAAEGRKRAERLRANPLRRRANNLMARD